MTVSSPIPPARSEFRTSLSPTECRARLLDLLPRARAPRLESDDLEARLGSQLTFRLVGFLAMKSYPRLLRVHIEADGNGARLEVTSSSRFGFAIARLPIADREVPLLMAADVERVRAAFPDARA